MVILVLSDYIIRPVFLVPTRHPGYYRVRGHRSGNNAAGGYYRPLAGSYTCAYSAVIINENPVAGYAQIFNIGLKI